LKSHFLNQLVADIRLTTAKHNNKQQQKKPADSALKTVFIDRKFCVYFLYFETI